VPDAQSPGQKNRLLLVTVLHGTVRYETPGTHAFAPAFHRQPLVSNLLASREIEREADAALPRPHLAHCLFLLLQSPTAGDRRRARPVHDLRLAHGDLRLRPQPREAAALRVGSRPAVPEPGRHRSVVVVGGAWRHANGGQVRHQGKLTSAQPAPFLILHT
jgi:hypothetical protein